MTLHRRCLCVFNPILIIQKWANKTYFNMQMGDASIEVTDENREASQLAKGNAMEAISEGAT